MRILRAAAGILIIVSVFVFLFSIDAGIGGIVETAIDWAFPISIMLIFACGVWLVGDALATPRWMK